MEKRPAISVGQLFSMLFISRMVVSMTYGTLLTGDSDIWDHLISAPICFLATFFLVFPVYKLFSMDKKMNLIDNLCESLGRFGWILIILYIAYYLIISFHTLAVFNNFILGAVNPPISLPLLSMLLLSSACYGAYKGLEALARTSNFILMATVFSVLFLGISLFSSIESINFRPLLYNGTESMTQGVIYMLSQSSCIPALAILLPMAKGNHKSGIFIWNTSVYTVLTLIIILLIGTMGDFAGTQLFPVYTAAGIGKFGSFRHLDSLYLGIWISGIFLKLSLFLLLAGEGVKKIWGEKARKISIVIFSALMAVFPFFSENLNILHETFITEFLFVFLLIISVAIPIMLIVLRKSRTKKEKLRFEN